MRKLFLLSALCVLTLTLVGCKDKNDEPEAGGEVNIDCSPPANVEAVDLGLPSGIKWANMNVGATTPEEYGAHFAWGETKSKSEYSWYKYMLCSAGSWFSLTKYTRPDGQAKGIWYNGKTFIGDNKTTLEPEDDAAHVNWGGDWRMPTYAEWSELKNTDNCTWEWKENYNGTNVNGYLVTSKKAGYADRFIFLPAAGHYEDISYISPKIIGDYWSASLDSYSHGAYRLYFGGDASVDCSGIERYRGFSVRPVCK